MRDFAALLGDVKVGRPSAWDECYRWLAPAVAGYLRLQGAREVDDLTSEVFLAMFRNIATFDGTEANFRSWVFVIAHRRLQDERRRRLRKPQPDPIDDVPESALGDSGDAFIEVMKAIADRRVRTICSQLAPDQRDVVLLRILGDLSVDQVAEVLGKSSGAVKQLQRRGFEAIRRLLEREGVPL
jgi:RNA polymerase sigma-70 factor (ECF subfamily)